VPSIKVAPTRAIRAGGCWAGRDPNDKTLAAAANRVFRPMVLLAGCGVPGEGSPAYC